MILYCIVLSQCVLRYGYSWQGLVSRIRLWDSLECCTTTLLVVFGQVGLTAYGLKSRLVFARVVCWPPTHLPQAWIGCWKGLLNLARLVWPVLLHWSGFCWRCLSPCWTARTSCFHIGDNCKWGSIPRARGELAEDKGTSFGLQGGYAINH